MTDAAKDVKTLSKSKPPVGPAANTLNTRRNSVVATKSGWILFAIILFALTAIGLVAAFGSGQTENPEQATLIRRMPVRTVAIELVTSIDQLRTYTGDVRARQHSDLGFELSGRIAEIMVDEGDRVEIGQILALLDTRTLNARKDAIAASLNQAQARLLELQVGPRRETIAASQASVREADSALQLAELNFERRRKLRESNAISTEEFQRARFDLQSARAVVDSAQKRLDELEAGTRGEQLTGQEAAVAQLEASLKEITVQIDKSSIVAPFAGRIVKRMADPGGLGLPSQPILELVETDHLEAVIGLPAEVAATLNPDESIFVSVAGQAYPGKILAKIQQLDTATRTQNVLINLDSAASEIVLPGQLCQIELSSKLEVSGYWVPASALTNGIRGLWSLMVVDQEGRASRNDVEVIYTDGDRALVRGTLSSDSVVIAEGTHRIVDGQRVEVLEYEATKSLSDSE